MQTKFTLVLAAAALILVALAAWPVARAQTQPTTGPKWQYGRLVLGTGDPVFVTARRESVVRPPRTGLGNGQPANAPSSNKETFDWKDGWNTEMMALDALGAEGWEAFSTLNDGRTTTIFLRKPN